MSTIPFRDELERQLAAALDVSDLQLQQISPIGGGCINQAARLDSSAGEFFLKHNPGSATLPGLFLREAEGLRALQRAEHDLVIPQVIVAHDDFLVLQMLRPAARVDDFDERLGRGLAQLHSSLRRQGDVDNPQARFGFGQDNYCGATPQPNPWEEDWLTFYRDHRLGHQLQICDERRGFTTSQRAGIERLLTRLDDLLETDEPPALLHGDLWSGNLHRDARGLPALIDPACYFGHREAELGMMQLFGGFSPRVWAAYEEIWPLQDGWRERLPLYELYHVLNHYYLFGGGYGAQAIRIVARFVDP